MKTLKILVALIFVLGFTWNRANAQVEKSVYDQFWSFNIECIDEVISGWCTLTNFTWPGSDRHVIKLDGVLIGERTKKEYTISDHWNYIWSAELNTSTQWEETQMVRCGNKLVAVVHMNFLLTVDENGNIDFKVGNYKAHCK